MPTIAESLNNIRLLDELSGQATPVHRLHPLAKLLTTLSFLVITVSFGKYDLSAMLPLIIYPVALMITGDIPFAPLLKRARFFGTAPQTVMSQQILSAWERSPPARTVPVVAANFSKPR